jgi:hypothetical protein
MQQIHSKHQWTYCEEVFSTLSMRQLCDAKIEEMLAAVFSM